MSIIRFNGVQKLYGKEETALHSVSLEVKAGEFTALAGPSGSGKTTILNIAAGLDKPSSGEASLLGYDLRTLSPELLCQLRRKKVGFIFQSYNLFPVLNVLENVEYPLALNQVPRNRRIKMAFKALNAVGLRDYAYRFPNQLSGGQQQRVAVARAIVNCPQIVFADEPTANLDSKTATHLVELFKELNEKKGITFLFSSHDALILKHAKRVIEVSDGQIKSDSGQVATKPKFKPLEPPKTDSGRDAVVSDADGLLSAKLREGTA